MATAWRQERSLRPGESSRDERATVPTLEPDRIKRGEYYEDCASQPVVCTDADYANDLICGISLLTGHLGSCDLKNCGVRKLTPDEALDRAVEWEDWAAERGLEPDRSKY